MASVKLFVRGHEELSKKYYAHATRLGEVTNKQLSAIGKMLKSDVIKDIKKINGNRTETRYNPQRTVTVSKEGKSPNHDRGRLVRGIRAFVKRGAKGKYNLEFQSRAPYALDLEFGTRNMSARPYMRPALKRNKKRIRSMLASGVRRAL